MDLSKKYITLYLVLISGISLLLKLYLIDFSLPVNSDNLVYTLNAIAYSQGNFTQLPDRALGWSIFASPFMWLVNSENFIDYSNIMRIISLTLATVSIPAVYLLGRKYFNEKYSLVVASLFAFEPHLNYDAGFGLSEPLYHLVIICALYFLLNKNSKFIIPSLILAAAAWWIRINGFGVIIVITVIYFIVFRKSSHSIRNYCLGLVAFLIIISPMIIQKYEQYGSPFYSWYGDKMFSDNYEMLVSKNIEHNDQSPTNYINEHGFEPFFKNFVLNGIYNILSLLFKISFPYLIILIPFGLIFSLRAFDQDNKYIKSNWIFLIVSLGFLIPILSLVPERRYLFYIFPFLMIFATIPIQRVVEYGLSTFSFSNKQKNLFLVAVIGIVIIMSGLFTVLQYGKPDATLEYEKIEFAKYLASNLNGKLLDEPGIALDYVSYIQIIDSPAGFKNYKMDLKDNQSQTNSLQRIYLYAKSMKELVSIGESYNLKYVISNENAGFFHPYVDDAYVHEIDYPYLHKIFDSNEHGFTKLKVKVFEIDYTKFHGQ